MQDGFELINPDAARAFYASLPQRVRREGASLVERGAIQEFSMDKLGRAFSALVRAEEEYQVRLDYIPDFKLGGEWDGRCA